jgi:acyl carrier protein
MDNKKKIIALISKTLNIDSSLINQTSSMNDFAKWDSLKHLNLMLEIEKQFKKKINTSKMADLNSVDKILKFIEK